MNSKSLRLSFCVLIGTVGVPVLPPTPLAGQDEEITLLRAARAFDGPLPSESPLR